MKSNCKRSGVAYYVGIDLYLSQYDVWAVNEPESKLYEPETNADSK